jgi:hypothetical protein
VGNSLLVRHIPLQARPIWHRRFLAVFFTLTVIIHLSAFMGLAHTNAADTTFNLLAFAAAASAAAAFTLGQESASSRSAPSSYRKYGAWSERSLEEQLHKALENASRKRVSLGIMLIAIEVPMRAWDDSHDVTRKAVAIVRDSLLSTAGENEQVFTMRSGRVAFVAAGDRALARLESVADHLQWDARVQFTRVAALAGCALTFGLTEADAVKTSGVEVLRNAELALRRATTLRTGRYVVSPRSF